MKSIAILILSVAFLKPIYGQQLDLSEFTMTNGSSPAFLLVGETPTSIYTPDNIKAIALHVQENIGESIAIEANPYFLVNQDRRDRTYQKYIGVMMNPETNELRQNPFSGLNTTSISLAYVNKEFSNINEKLKTYSIGIRTTLLRFYNKEKVHQNTIDMATALSNIEIPNEVLIEGAEAIQQYYTDHQETINKLIEPYQKTIKPIFRLDAAAGYSTLFIDNNISSGTLKRYGMWGTAETSFILNEGSQSKTNNYFNVLITARYIEDGFNIVNEEYVTGYYRDFGGKLEFEFGRLGFGYEFISREGDQESKRSVGIISFTIDKNISLSGGFGKDFESADGDNLLTIFGIHWGLNPGNSKVNIAQ